MKEDDKYTCPICDWRVKIPRDAARPKLEELQDWQAEILGLPFQPDEEECLNRIIHTAQAFRDFVRPYINPLMTTQEEVPTQRFYLRKIEGAEILLAWETNFFRQELHRWAPVASMPPPVLEHSHSTRKPRPTKQQKLMAQLGIDNPENLPQSLRTKHHTSYSRKSSASHSRATPALQATPLTLASNSAASGGGGGGSGGAGLGSNHHSFVREHHHHPPPFSYEGNFSLHSPPGGGGGGGGGHVSPHFPVNDFISSHDERGPPPPPTLDVTLGGSTLDPALFNGSALRREGSDHAGTSDTNAYGGAQGADDGDGGGGDVGEGNNSSANVDSIFADLINHDDAEAGETSQVEDDGGMIMTTTTMTTTATTATTTATGTAAGVEVGVGTETSTAASKDSRVEAMVEVERSDDEDQKVELEIDLYMPSD